MNMPFAFLMSICMAVGCGDAAAMANGYPEMSPIGEYLIADKSAEIALARSAAPAAISAHAEVWTLEARGYARSAVGANGFVCLVQRSWWARTDDANFWNPKVRAPICFNAAAARSYLPLMLERTSLLLSGRSTTEMLAAVTAALDDKRLSSSAVGAMCYMMSKQGYLNDRVGHWHPHLMFFVPITPGASWGAGTQASPVLAAEDPENRLTVFLIPLSRWSDGTAEHSGGH